MIATFSTKKDKAKFRATEPWKTFRLALLEDRGARCECCGTKFYGKQKKSLQIHHLDPLHYNDLQPHKFKILCSTCHKSVVEKFASKLRGKNATDIPRLAVWVSLIYDMLPYDVRIALYKYHDTYLTERWSEWAIKKDTDKQLFID